MLIECKYCEAVVDARVISSYDSTEEDLDIPIKFSFLCCPKCSSPFLIVREQFVDESWGEPSVLFPPKDKQINPNLPVSIKNSYGEALSAFKAKAYTASTLMCRKTLEGICRAHDIQAKNLASALKEMKNKGIIENRLFEWAEALRITGNKAAHDVETVISIQDAKDIIQFTDALLEYVFTFKDKFNEFTKRRKKSESV